ncbi:flippase [Halobacillus faecis]
MYKKIKDKIYQKNAFMKIIKNTSWLTLEQFIKMGTSLLIGVWITRYLGPSDYGLYSFVLSLVFLFTPLVKFGLDRIIVKELVKEPENEKEILATGFFIQAIGGLLLIVLSLISTYLLSLDSFTKVLVLIVSLGYFFKCFDIIDYYFQSKLNSKYSVIARGVAFSVISITRIALLMFDAPLIYFVIATALEVFLNAIGFIVLFIKKNENKTKWRLSYTRGKSLFKDSLPLTISGVAVALYMKIDQTMIAQLSSEREVGFYSAATKLTEAWNFIPVAIMVSITPVLLKLRDSDWKKYVSKFEQVFTLLFVLGLCLAIPVSIFAEKIIYFLYGSSYLSSSSILSIHIWTSIFIFIGLGRRPYILSESLFNYSMWTNLIGVTINILLNFIFIPKYGALGASYTTLISQFFVTYFCNVFHNKTRFLFLQQSKALILLPIFKTITKKLSSDNNK